MARYAGVDPTPAYDATLAGALQDFFKNVVLMDGLAAHGTSEAEFMAEALDSFRAHRSTADKLAVEEARFHLLEHECAQGIENRPSLRASVHRLISTPGASLVT